MFGRVRRGAAKVTDPSAVHAYAVLHVYNPETVAGVAAIGLGAAGIASGPAAGRAVGDVLEWGKRAKRRYLALPRRVLAVVNDDSVVLHEWTVLGGCGAQVARWLRGGFTAEKVHYAGEVGVRVQLSGAIAVLTVRHGPTHRAARATVAAILGVAQT